MAKMSFHSLRLSHGIMIGSCWLVFGGPGTSLCALLSGGLMRLDRSRYFVGVFLRGGLTSPLAEIFFDRLGLQRLDCGGRRGLLNLRTIHRGHRFSPGRQS